MQSKVFLKDGREFEAGKGGRGSRRSSHGAPAVAKKIKPGEIPQARVEPVVSAPSESQLYLDVGGRTLTVVQAQKQVS